MGDKEPAVVPAPRSLFSEQMLKACGSTEAVDTKKTPACCVWRGSVLCHSVRLDADLLALCSAHKFIVTAAQRQGPLFPQLHRWGN